MQPRLRPATVASLLFCSGLCALIYQTVWLREFRLIFGASTAASAAVLGIFMGGLGLGSAFLGRRAERSVKPLLLYGNLELLIAIFAAVTPLIVMVVRHAYMATGGTMVLGHFTGTVVRLLMASIVLIGPTFLMGGTLPAAARSIATNQDSSRRRLALLYGMNTLGAVTGAAISTFWLVELVGNRNTLWIAAGANIIVAIVARSIGRSQEDLSSGSSEEPEREITPAEPYANPKLVIISSAIVGFAFMMMELVWYRMLSPILGGSTFTFGLILVVALLGIGLGGVAYTLRPSRQVPTLNGFAFTCALEALFIAIPYALGDRLAMLALMLRPLGAIGFASQAMGWAIVASIVILPAALVAGFQFPMLIGLLGRGRADVARDTGTTYAANTVGAIVGSLLGGFGALPLLTAPGVWKLVTVLLALLAIVAAIGGRAQSARYRFMPLFASATAVSLLFAAGPSAFWRHSGIGAGRGGRGVETLNDMRTLSNFTNRSIVWEAEGVESSVALHAADGLSFIVNGKADGNARGDAGTQVMSGILAALLHPNPKTVMIIGLGTGSTAGWLGAVPEVERVDVVELEPAILEVARKCAAVNQNVMDNPKVHCHLGDAREVLITTPQKYDIVFSEPSNPYRAGIASLFTLDFYEAAKQRLKPGGIFVQWVQSYEIDAQTLQTVFGTVSKAFPHVQTWRTLGPDLLLVSSMEPFQIDAKTVRDRMTKPVIRSALLSAWRVDSLEGVLAHFVGNEDLVRKVTLGKPVIATDDRNALEYGFARGLGRSFSKSLVDEVTAYADREQCTEVPLLMEGVDRDRVRHFGIAAGAFSSPTRPILNESPNGIAWRKFFGAYSQKDYKEALDFARREGLAPSSPMEIEAFTVCTVFVQDESANEWIQKLDGLFPSEAVAMRACQAAMRKDWPTAVGHFVAAFERWRTDPWTDMEMMSDSMNTACLVAAGCQDPKLARMLFDALSPSFAVDVHREDRLGARIKIARHCDVKQANATMIEAYAPFEQHPLWNRNFLDERVKTFAVMKDGRLPEVIADLVEFMENSATPFDSNLPREKHDSKAPEAPRPSEGVSAR